MGTIVQSIAPFLLVAGFYLIVRTVAMGDPTLPFFPREDTSYEITLQPKKIAQNTLAYLTWTLESSVWPKPGSLIQPIENALAEFMKSTQVEGLLYPGLFALVGLIIVLCIFWRNSVVRNSIIFGALWWVVCLAPNLLLANERSIRWLTLSSWGYARIVSIVLWKIFSPIKRFRIAIIISIAICFLMYGFWMARSPQILHPYTEISQHARTSIAQYAAEVSKISPQRIFFQNISPDLRGTVNRQLLLLFFENVPLSYEYINTLEILPSVL